MERRAATDACGSHFVSLEAHDSRGAVHRTDGELIFVDGGPACLVF